jgi:hypothetical protein
MSTQRGFSLALYEDPVSQTPVLFTGTDGLPYALSAGRHVIDEPRVASLVVPDGPQGSSPA